MPARETEVEHNILFRSHQQVIEPMTLQGKGPVQWLVSRAAKWHFGIVITVPLVILALLLGAFIVW